MTDIRLAAVSKTFPAKPPVRALDRVDLDIASGTILAVLGISGCGKTTLLRTVAGFEAPDRGTIHFGTKLVADATTSLPPERRSIGIVPQEGALFPHLDVAGNIGFALRGRDRKARRDRVGELLELIGLPGYQRRKPDQLSGGQQQRVALARALAPRPAVVLLDEPFTALDVSLRARLRTEVASILRLEQTTAVLVTHDPSEALAMADEVATMASGRILQVSPGPQLYHRPTDIDSARLLGEVVTICAHIDGATASSPLGVITLAADQTATQGDTTVLLRPEQIVCDDSSPVRATVTAVSYNGHDMLVGLQVDHHQVTARWAAADVPQTGESRGVRVVGDALFTATASDGSSPTDAEALFAGGKPASSKRRWPPRRRPTTPP